MHYSFNENQLLNFDRFYKPITTNKD